MIKYQVYIVQRGKSGPVKIGSTKNGIKQRLKNLQIECPEKLHLLKVFNNGEFMELDLHRRFAHLRVRGEWFELQGELKEFINNPCKEIIEKVKTPELNVTELRIALARLNKKKVWLAEMCGFSRQYLHMLIQGRSLKYVDKFAEILEVPVSQLITTDKSA